MSKDSFFNEQLEQSEVKSAIVAKYFTAWARVIVSAQRSHPNYSDHKIGYIDLFCGPGRYHDGSLSTPIRVLSTATKDPDLRDRLVSMFNDRDEQNTRNLETAISKIEGIQTLKYRPKVYCAEVGEEIAKAFEKMAMIPSLFFVDPWGYKGLSLRLINSVLKDWGSDCIFFFNYNRINMGLSNPFVKEHMDSLFGADRADELRKKLSALGPVKRELTIVEELCRALKQYGNRYVLPFRFRNSEGSRTSHHLIFVSKHIRGYEIMKEIMAKESSSQEDGVPSFEYSP
ncbi:MAG TPA: three-Cys-motif partner protein TcmP, partial [Spirochaetia bacterium]|nr:three-Cys-motif partner protein TcmP [Spirochaetia bacterium]